MILTRRLNGSVKDMMSRTRALDILRLGMYGIISIPMRATRLCSRKLDCRNERSVALTGTFCTQGKGTLLGYIPAQVGLQQRSIKWPSLFVLDTRIIIQYIILLRRTNDRPDTTENR